MWKWSTGCQCQTRVPILNEVRVLAVVLVVHSLSILLLCARSSVIDTWVLTRVRRLWVAAPLRLASCWCTRGRASLMVHMWSGAWLRSNANMRCTTATDLDPRPGIAHILRVSEFTRICWINIRVLGQKKKHSTVITCVRACVTLLSKRYCNYDVWNTKSWYLIPMQGMDSTNRSIASCIESQTMNISLLILHITSKYCQC